MLRRVASNCEGTPGAMAALSRDAANSITGVPVRTGRLAGSMGVVDVDGQGFAVGSVGVPYAGFVFNGTSRQPPRPPRVPVNAIRSGSAQTIGRAIVR